jgi:7-cyano-7-deazaguanine synthase
VTYVPARNTIMLSLALGWAEVLGASDIFVGVTAVDFSGYPDCRPEFIAAFENLTRVATKAGVEGHPCHIHAPLISLSKAEIIREGVRLGVDYGLTVSCYQADEHGRACGRCDSCRLRAAGFAAAGVPDPTAYRDSGVQR